MPELPEVETISRQLDKYISGKKIQEVDVLLPKFVRMPVGEFKKIVGGSSVVCVSRRGKLVLIELSNGYILVVHLKLSGQLVFNGEKNKHTHVIYRFVGGDVLLHNDLRKFGFVKVIKKKEINNFFVEQKLGIEPLGKNLSFKVFDSLLKKKTGNIKTILMDQSVLVGVGNIYANEILFAAGIHPERKVSSLEKDELRKIFLNLKRILKLAIKKRGSSDRDYIDASGEHGEYMKMVKVYGQEKKPCLKCGAKIQRIKFGGRSSYFCPKCQK